MSTTRKIEGEQTPLPPLLSDDDALTMARKEASNWRVGNQSDAVAGAEETILAVRKIYEADRAKTREVVQRLVDALQRERLKYSDIVDMLNIDRALALAKSQLNIEPTK